MHAHSCLSPLLLCLSAGVANLAWAHPEYRVTMVGPAASEATGINKDGVVIGNYRVKNGATHGFLNRGKGLVDLGILDGRASSAVAINDKGQVLGQWRTAGGEQRGFIYHAGSRRDIGTLPGRITYWTDINDGGFITGYGPIKENYDDQRGFLRAPDGTLTNLGFLPYERPITYAFALNNSNRVTGASGPLFLPDPPLHAFVWAKGVMSDLGNLGSAPNYGVAINDCGQITGSMSVPTPSFHNRVAYLYTNGRLLDIDGRGPTEERDSAGTAINCHGHVVGVSNHLSGFVYRGKRMQSLNALIDSKQHWNIRFPVGINDAGQIAATGYRNGVRYALRLDLLRPMLARAPEREPEAEAALQALAPAPEPQAETQAREVVQPVGQ